jgi:predicted  nucleic acid-binding Zn-ribbon protein
MTVILNPVNEKTDLIIMFKIIKNLLKKEKNELAVIRFEGIPGFLDVREAKEKEDLRVSTGNSMNTINGARNELLNLVEILGRSEKEKALHPKLEKIAQNSIPLFEKSMMTALSRPMPDDPLEFYDAAAECLKGCVKSLTGPGRYIRGVLPDEMKAIRIAIDHIGQEMNSMTRVHSEYRRSMDQAAKTRELYEQVVKAQEEKKSCDVQIPEIQGKIRSICESIAQLEDELQKLKVDRSPGYHAILEEEKNARILVNDTEREMRAVFATLVHVFRKAEKIAAKGHDKMGREISSSVELMTEPKIPDWDLLKPSIERTQPLVMSMIQAGSISLKNKEEKELFGGPDIVFQMLGALSGRLLDYNAGLHSLETRIATDPANKRIHGLEKNEKELKEELEKENGQCHNLERHRKDVGEKIPVLIEDLQRSISVLNNEETKLEI